MRGDDGDGRGRDASDGGVSYFVFVLGSAISALKFCGLPSCIRRIGAM